MKNFTHWNLDTKNIGLLVFLISLLFSFTMDLKWKFKISRITQLIFIRIKTNDHGPLNHWRHNKLICIWIQLRFEAKGVQILWNWNNITSQDKLILWTTFRNPVALDYGLTLNCYWNMQYKWQVFTVLRSQLEELFICLRNLFYFKSHSSFLLNLKNNS